MEKVRYMISDAANIVAVESHVLRYWEDELALDIPRNELGHRYYTKENIAQFQKIKELKEKGYQLRAIRMILHNGGVDAADWETALSQPLQQPTQQQSALLQPQPPTQQQSAPLQPQPPTQQQSALLRQQSMAQSRLLQTLPPSRASQLQSELPSSSVPQQSMAQSQLPQTQSVLENTDKMAQFTELMTEIVGKALAANNEALSKSISEDVGEQVLKEMNYLMREREEAEEERFRRLDEAIRSAMKKKSAPRWSRKNQMCEKEKSVALT